MHNYNNFITVIIKNAFFFSSTHSYDFKQTVVDSTDNIYTNPDFSNSVNLSFQLGVCKNVDSPKKPCSGESAVFMVHRYVILRDKNISVNNNSRNIILNNYDNALKYIISW